MCLVVSKEAKEEVLKEDLIVYKLMKKKDDSLVSFYVRFFYTLGHLYVADLKREGFNHHNVDHSYADNRTFNEYDGMSDLYCYVKGFHSYLTLKRLYTSDAFKCFVSSTIVECTIPKGSVIVRDKTELVVSNQIIINKEL